MVPHNLRSILSTGDDMKLSFGRIVITAVLIEVMAILLLVLLVALAGPSDPDAAQELTLAF